MAEESNILREGVDRFREAFGSIEDELERVQKDLRGRRKSFEKQIDSSRRDFERRSRKLRTELRKNETVKQLEDLRKRATRQIEQSVDGVLAALQIASKSDLERIDRKITQLNKKLKDIDGTKKRANGRAAA